MEQALSWPAGASTEGRVAMVRQMLFSRGIEVPEDFPADVPGFAESSEAAQTLSGAIFASAPNAQSSMRNPVKPRAAHAPGSSMFAIDPHAGAWMSTGS